ncbi:bacterial sugar transferase family protein [Synechococcus sp. PROS-7-1]|uniref:sugar transferase n=1 Tax=Synechococcus sp. PROS-7-1 TaxID=1442556 RepID=UPI001644FBC5|nr:sugar transferase [Synechococcus sp. PROS-7-1]QNI84126.1 bacterial sugar transferase family protein [Synechococcus sp. PROS-7-1]
MKNILERLLAFVVLFLLTPLLSVFLLLIFLEDPSSSPIYVQQRVGKHGKLFRLYKLRSMRPLKSVNFTSTSSKDPRILKTGRIIRKIKLDEIPQLVNIIFGTMSFVGPRPNVQVDVDLYTPYERTLLQYLPGITDPSSIIFSDESSILEPYSSPDLAYNKLIRPWKNVFALRYFKDNTSLTDFLVIILTFMSGINRVNALRLVSKILKCPSNSIYSNVAKRSIPLEQVIIDPPVSASSISW